jgi:hypothetical protein
MPCTLRKPELDELSTGILLPPIPSRIQRLKNLICGGPWSARDDIVTLYWKPDPGAPNGAQWVAWIDTPAPKVDPLPEASVSITP